MRAATTRPTQVTGGAVAQGKYVAMEKMGRIADSARECLHRFEDDMQSTDCLQRLHDCHYYGNEHHIGPEHRDGERRR